jgi:hypothetical protein
MCGAFTEALSKVLEDWALHVCSVEAQQLHSDVPLTTAKFHLLPALPMLHLTACVPPSHRFDTDFLWALLVAVSHSGLLQSGVSR